VKEEKDELFFENSGRGKLNYNQLIGYAILEVIKCSSKPLSLSDEARDCFFNIVITLDRTLEPLKDKDFEADKKKIAALNPPYDRITTLDEFQEWYGLCCRLIGRIGLLPEENTTEVDEYDDETESRTFTPKKKDNQQ
jgi:hypothetical protein